MLQLKWLINTEAKYDITKTATKISFRRNFVTGSKSFLELYLQPVTKFSSTWRHIRFSTRASNRWFISTMTFWCHSITSLELACSASYLFKFSCNTRQLISNPELSKIMVRVKRTLMGISYPRSASVGPSCWNICWLTLEYDHVTIGTFQ